MTPRFQFWFRFFLYSAWALFTTWGTAMAGVRWDSMGWEDQSCLLVGIAANWVGLILAYSDKSSARYEASQPPKTTL